jgi:hypothetical protein
MKKTAVVFGISLLALLIVLPVVSTVKQVTTYPSLNSPGLQADGSPLPAPIPKPHALDSDSWLVADGSPLPAPIPKPHLALS